MLQSIGFYASPAPGSRFEELGFDGSGFLICDVPDAESFLRDLLGRENLVLDSIDRIEPVTLAEIDLLPEQVRNQFHRKRWSMVFRQYQNPPIEE